MLELSMGIECLPLHHKWSEPIGTTVQRESGRGGGTMGVVDPTTRWPVTTGHPMIRPPS